MSNVRGFVRINTGVLDQNLARMNTALWPFIGSQRGCEVLALNAGIDVSSSGKFQRLKTFDWSDAGYDLFSNLPGRLSQLLRQFKSKRQRVFAKLDPGRLLDHDPRQIETVVALHKLAYLLGKPMFQLTVQEAL